MGKYVYLFELDSVRKTDEEILAGQKALYEEIVGNGNRVVLSYNQFVDSRGFFSLLDDPLYYENIVKLFEYGYIKLSRYGDKRSITQYLIDSLAYEKEFIYSGWPLKSTQKRMLALIKRSLTYNDLSEIRNYIDDKNNDDEITDLFIEVTKDGPLKKDVDVEYCKHILQQLYSLLKTVLRLSANHKIYLEPKAVRNNRSLVNMNLLKYLCSALSLPDNSFANKNPELWKKAKAILKEKLELDEGTHKRSVFDFNNKSGSNARSDIIHALKQLYDKRRKADPDLNPEPYRYAEAIIDLCYNYVVEFSIRNSSKHYTISDFESDDPSSWESFSYDFFSRLNQTWSVCNPEKRYLQEETDIYTKFDKKKYKDFPDFSRAVRFIEYATCRKKNKNEEDNIEKNKKPVERYEHNLFRQRRKQKEKVENTIGIRLFFTFVSLAVACSLELGLQKFQSILDEYIPWNFVTETLLFLVLTEFITWLISLVVPGFLSLSEAVGSFARLISDLFVMWLHKVKTYRNICPIPTSTSESFNEGRRIDYILTEPLNKYKQFRNTNPELFKESSYYDIENFDKNTDAKYKELLRVEELYGKKFGLVYSSKYTNMIVDPIKQNNPMARYFSYDRIAPTGKAGTIMVTMHGDKFILLQQFRHAPRKEQYAFPRGFNEEGLDPLENVRKELSEELNAKITEKPVHLGKINPDSGITSSSADVYLVKINDYKASKDEGIVNRIEVSETDFKKMITDFNADNTTEKGKPSFDDGYTLAAFTLYQIYKEQLLQ